MKILTDLGHPKNVLVLKNLVPRLEALGHEMHFVCRDREHIHALCRAFGFLAIDRGPGGTGMLGKFVYLLRTDWQLVKLAKKIKPDLLLSFGSPYLANLALIARIPMIVLDDTEQNRLVQRIYSSCSAAIVVPSCFGKTLNRRQFSFNGYYELAYLSPSHFQPDPGIGRELGLAQGEKFALLRFVSWQAVHDMSHHGLNREEKQELPAAFSRLARVFISAEGPLPAALEPLRLRISPERIHQVLAQAALVFSEGATMAAEAAVLGVPTVHCSDLQPGYIADLEKRHGLLRSFSHGNFREAAACGLEFLEKEAGLRQSRQEKRARLLEQCIDVTAFLAWFIDQFPQSAARMKNDPRALERFAPQTGHGS